MHHSFHPFFSSLCPARVKPEWRQRSPSGNEMLFPRMNSDDGVHCEWAWWWPLLSLTTGSATDFWRSPLRWWYINIGPKGRDGHTWTESFTPTGTASLCFSSMQQLQVSLQRHSHKIIWDPELGNCTYFDWIAFQISITIDTANNIQLVTLLKSLGMVINVMFFFKEASSK